MGSKAWPHSASVCSQHLHLITLLPWCEGRAVMGSVYIFNILVKLAAELFVPCGRKRVPCLGKVPLSFWW